ncbi:hypothetical protein SCA6_006308 [Theobroma cacao]
MHRVGEHNLPISSFTLLRKEITCVLVARVQVAQSLHISPVERDRAAWKEHQKIPSEERPPSVKLEHRRLML